MPAKFKYIKKDLGEVTFKGMPNEAAIKVLRKYGFVYEEFADGGCLWVDAFYPPDDDGAFAVNAAKWRNATAAGGG